MTRPDILNDFLVQLGVPHTPVYTAKRFDSMPFKTLYGLSKLLDEYGVTNKGLFVADKSEIVKLQPPFLAHTRAGLVVVTDIGVSSIGYVTQGAAQTAPLERFVQAFDGNILLAFPQKNKSCEPLYADHRRGILMEQGKKWLLLLSAAFLFIYLFVTSGVCNNVSTVLATAFYILGLAFTYLLVQKTLKIHNPAADSMCRVLQDGGCDTVLKTSASSFFGIFSWSEVGFAYFSVSLLALLIFPQWTGYLALCDALCLPFTIWSIWYQRFRAKAWCTLCVSVQATLWCIFFCYLAGGWFSNLPPLRIEFVVLSLTYVVVMLGLNRINLFISRKTDDNEDNQ